jgi:hypothetical protein
MNKTGTISLTVGHTVEVEVTPEIEQAIQAAKCATARGSTKVEAVREIFPSISHLPRESIWYAIINGVNISSRGAVTYYYNARREHLRSQ